MTAYLIVIIVTVVMLYLSFRALGTTPDPTVEEYRNLLRKLTQATLERAMELHAATAEAAAPLAQAFSDRENKAESIVELGQRLRKDFIAYQHQLERIEVNNSELDETRNAVTVALDDLHWACRLLASGTYDDNIGLQKAVKVLCAHAESSLEHAARSAMVEP